MLPGGRWGRRSRARCRCGHGAAARLDRWDRQRCGQGRPACHFTGAVLTAAFPEVTALLNVFGCSTQLKINMQSGGSFPPSMGAV